MIRVLSKVRLFCRLRKMASGCLRSSSNPPEEEDIDKLRKENASLREILDELSRQQGAPDDPQHNHVYLEVNVNVWSCSKLWSQLSLVKMKVFVLVLTLGLIHERFMYK